jgi:hypothetical protein
MIDLHLINTALASVGIGAAAVVLIAVAILATFARRGRSGHQIAPARPAASAHAALSQDSEIKEPALR